MSSINSNEYVVTFPEGFGFGLKFTDTDQAIELPLPEEYQKIAKTACEFFMHSIIEAIQNCTSKDCTKSSDGISLRFSDSTIFGREFLKYEVAQDHFKFRRWVLKAIKEYATRRFFIRVDESVVVISGVVEVPDSPSIQSIEEFRMSVLASFGTEESIGLRKQKTVQEVLWALERFIHSPEITDMAGEETVVEALGQLYTHLRVSGTLES